MAVLISRVDRCNSSLKCATDVNNEPRGITIPCHLWSRLFADNNRYIQTFSMRESSNHSQSKRLV